MAKPSSQDDKTSSPKAVPHITKEITTRLCAPLFKLDQIELETDQLLWLSRSESSADKSEDFGSWLSKTEQAVNNVKKKRLSDNSAGDKPVVDHVTGNIRKTKGHSTVAHAMESSYFEGSLWRGCVEPRTYRYMPNNGQYRKSKAVVHKVLFQRPPRKVGEKMLTSEQKNLQREIQRELRKEFEMMQTQGRWAMSETETAKERVSVSNHAHSAERITHNNTKKVKPKQYDDNRFESKKDKSGDVAQSQSQQAPALPKAPRRSYSPVQLPPISVPLVNNSLVKSNLSESFNGKLHLKTVNDVPKPVTQVQVLQRTQRSASEPPPPPPSIKGPGPNKVDCIELCSFGNSNDNSSEPEFSHGSPTRSTSVPHQRRVARSSDNAQGLSSSKKTTQKAWNAHGVKTLETGTTESALSDVVLNSRGVPERVPPPPPPSTSETAKFRHREKSLARKDYQELVDVAMSVPTSQLRYMSASGEVTVIPQLGQGPRSSSFYKTLEKENHRLTSEDMSSQQSYDVRSNKENLQHVMKTSKVLSPLQVKTQHESGGPSAQFSRSQHGINNPSIIPSTQAKVNNDSFRGQAIGRTKSRDKKIETTVPASNDFLPLIAGRKCDMTATSHRIV